MLSLAWRNLWRKKWRSLLTTTAVGLVVLLTLVYFGLSSALTNGIYSQLTDASGHLQVHVEGYRDIRDFSDGLIDDAASVEETLSSVDQAQIVATLNVPGLLEGQGRSRGVRLQGFSCPDDLRDRYVERTLLEGSYPAAGDVTSIALGERLATSLKVGLGDTVYFYAPGTDGYGAAAYEVVGLLDEPAAVGLAHVSLAAGQELAAPGSASRFEIHLPQFNRLGDDENLPAIKQDLANALPAGLVIETWDEVDPSTASYIDIQEVSTVIVTGIFFVLAALLVTNTVYLSIVERTREFGVIRALGAGRRKVMGMVLLESLWLCTLGAVMGGGIGLAIVYAMSLGFSFPGAAAEIYAEFGLPTVLYASVDPVQVLITVVFVLATGLLAALYPAWTAGRLEPVEAMRFV